MNKTENFVIELPLATEKFQAEELNRRFELMRRIYNQAQNKLERQYLYFLSFRPFQDCKTNKEKREFLSTHSFSFKNFNDKAKEPLKITFTEFGIRSFLTKFAKEKVDSQYTYSDMGINTSMLSHMGNAIWSAWEKVIYKPDAKRIRYKRQNDLNSIGVDWEPKHPMGFLLDLEKRQLKLNINNRQGQYAKHIIMSIEFGKKERQIEYETDALKGSEENIKVLTIVRRKFKGKFRYFIQFTVRNNKPQKGRSLGKGKVAIDLGVTKIAIVTDNTVRIIPLAPNVSSIESQMHILQRKMDRSRRAMNPNNFNEDGTVKRGVRLTWVKSERYKALCQEKAELQRKQAAIRKRDHILLANQLIELGNEFIIEDNDVKEWAARRKEERRRKKDNKNLSKAGLGKFVNNHAPAMFVTILKNKVESLGGKFEKVPTENGATEYDFTNDTYTKHKLTEKFITLSDGIRHQRDTLAAFNLFFLRIEEKGSKKVYQYDRSKMKEKYAWFNEQEKEFLQSIKKTRKKKAS